ncbi:transposase [Micromonospora sp. NPDC049801]|uniref:IS110 family transposase n=1 Tax=unclassified Micromonospora TaxID=2617518 RepID=UPI0033D30424
MAEVSTYSRPVCWAVDVTTGLSALLLTLLWWRQVQVRYVSGTVAFRMAAAFAGENKTDARDAVVIAQTIRMRPDIPVLEPSDRLLAELTVLTGYRSDLVDGRVQRRQRTPHIPRLLREETRRRKEPPASHTRPRPTPRRRPLGAHPRRQDLHPTGISDPHRSLNQHVIHRRGPSRRPLHPAHQDHPKSHGDSICGPGLGERRSGERG